MKYGNAERIFVEHLQLTLNRKFLSLCFTRNHDESETLDAHRFLSLRQIFPVSFVRDPPSDLEHFSGNSGAPREYTDYRWATRMKSMGFHWDSFQARQRSS